MIDICSVKEFNKIICNEYKIIFVYFYVDDEWCKELNTKLFNIFNDNYNGNIVILSVNTNKIKIEKQENLTSVPIIRLYKNNIMKHEIYTTLPNLENIIKSLIN